MNIPQEQISEKIQLIKGVFKNKSVLPIYIQRKLLKQIDFQVKALEIRKNGSMSPKKKNQNLRQHTQPNHNNKLDRSFNFENLSHQECLKCKKIISQNIIKLQCGKTQHNFHEKCILDHFKELNENDQFRFTCICGKKLRPEYIKTLKIKGIEEQINLIYLKQVKEIANSVPTEKCRNAECNFFWVSDLKLKLQKNLGRQLKLLSKKFCPYC